MSLNSGQEKALNQFKEFLVSDEKYFCLTGGPGMGKTYLLDQIRNALPEFNKHMVMFGLPTYDNLVYTATTNKAASVFVDGATTIHKLLGLRVVDNYQTGKSKVMTTPRSQPLHDLVLVIDESSMLGPDILDILEQLVTDSCKVVFVGDRYQLPPVGYKEPTAFSKGHPLAELVQPMRQDRDSHLYSQCTALREAVATQQYIAPTPGKGVRLVRAEEFLEGIVEDFSNQKDVRVIAYQNHTTESFNTHIRQKLHNNDRFYEGDLVVASSAVEGRVKIGETYKIRHISKGSQEVHGIECYYVGLEGVDGLMATPVDKRGFFQVMKRAQREGNASGDWKHYFTLKNSILDIRDGFACTAHASQGSTYDKVYIDFTDMTECKDLNTFLRMLYVAFTRARESVIIYGM